MKKDNNEMWVMGIVISIIIGFIMQLCVMALFKCNKGNIFSVMWILFSAINYCVVESFRISDDK